MTQQHPAGWYPQPDGSKRYWDGNRWTEHTAPAPAQQPAVASTTWTAGSHSSAQAPPPAMENAALPQAGGAVNVDTRPLWQKKRVIIPAALLIAIVGISALNGGRNNDSQSAAPASSPSAQPSQESLEGSDPDEPSDAPEPELFTMPEVVGMSLQEAQDLLQGLGSHAMDQVDASGEGRAQIIDSNWKVCQQQPAAGQEVAITTTVVLSSVKEDESCPGSAELPETEASTEAEEPEQELAKIGDAVRVGDLSVTVKSAERKSKLSSVFGSKKGHWMVVDVKIANKGKEQVMVNDSDFTLVEADGTTYSTDSDGMTYVDSDDWIFLEKINPKTSATGTVIFAIPKSAKNLTLQVSSGLFGLETAEVSLGKK